MDMISIIVNQFQLQIAQSSAWRISIVKHVPIGEKCYTKGDLFSGHWSPSFRGTTYLRLPQSVETSQLININVSNPCRNNKLKVIGTSSMYHNPSKTMRWAYLYYFASALGVVEFLFILSGWWLLFRSG
ncbi:hypothetical protein CerSpe_181930 [Prunus speciosa]